VTDFNVIAEEELRSVLDQLLGMQWPIPITEVFSPGMCGLMAS